MDDVENSAIQEVAPQLTENRDNTQTQESKTDNSQDRNWREMRRKQQDLERELKMQREMNERLLQMASQNQPKAIAEVDEFDSIGDDEYIPKGKVAKLVEQKAEKKAAEAARKEVEKFMQQQYQSTFLDRLKREYSDFEDVVNADTLSILEEKKPALAQAIAESKDPYKIGVQSYEYIKAFNLQGDVSKSKRAKEVEDKLEKNAKTVPSPQAYDKRPMAAAFKMTETEKKALYEEMMISARGSGFSY